MTVVLAVVSVTETVAEPLLPATMPTWPLTLAEVFTMTVLEPVEVALIPVPVVVVTMSLELTLIVPEPLEVALMPPVVPLMVPPAALMVIAPEPFSAARMPMPFWPVTLAPVKMPIGPPLDVTSMPLVAPVTAAA